MSTPHFQKTSKFTLNSLVLNLQLNCQLFFAVTTNKTPATVWEFYPGIIYEGAESQVLIYMLAKNWHINATEITYDGDVDCYTIKLPYSPKSDTITRNVFGNVTNPIKRQKVGRFERPTFGDLTGEDKKAAVAFEKSVLAKLAALKDDSDDDASDTEKERSARKRKRRDP